MGIFLLKVTVIKIDDESTVFYVNGTLLDVGRSENEASSTFLKGSLNVHAVENLLPQI